MPATRRTLDALAEIGRWLGLGIGNLINVFNPQLVVLGGFYHALFPFLEKAVFEGARLGALDAPGDIADIAASGLGPDAPLIGAAELAISEVIADPAGTLAPGPGDAAQARAAASAKIRSMTSILAKASWGGVGTGVSSRMARENASACTRYWSAAGT